MIVLPGSIRFTAAQLREELEKCHSCKDGWIYVAYGFEDGKYSVYKLPCKCTVSSGKEFWMLLNPDIYRNMVLDFQATPAQLPGHVFIHPQHTRKFEKLLNRVRQVLERQRAEASDAEPPF